MDTNFDLGALRFLPNCDKNHRVIGLMDGDFIVAEIHIPFNTPLREIDATVRKVMDGQL